MNEATLVGELERALRKEMPGCAVLKHNDSSTAGIPDLSVTWNGRTAWLEVKFSRPGSRAEVSVIQQQTLRRLRGYTVWYVFSPSGVKTTSLSRADGLDLIFDGIYAHADVACEIRKRL